MEEDKEKGDTTFSCPVCGARLHETNMPDKESIVEDNLYREGGVLMLSSHVLLRCDFEHQFEKEDVTVDEPHGLVALVEAVFDESGECIQFNISKIHPAEKSNKNTQKKKETASASLIPILSIQHC